MTSREKMLINLAVRSTMGYLLTFNQRNVSMRLEKAGLGPEEITAVLSAIHDHAMPYFDDMENVPEGMTNGDDYRTLAIYDSASSFNN